MSTTLTIATAGREVAEEAVAPDRLAELFDAHHVRLHRLARRLTKLFLRDGTGHDLHNHGDRHGIRIESETYRGGIRVGQKEPFAGLSIHS